LYEGAGEDEQEGKIIRENNKILVKTEGKSLIQIHERTQWEAKKVGGERNNWMGRIKQTLRRNGMTGIWENGRNNNKKVCIRKRKRMCYYRKAKYENYNKREKFTDVTV
jgi:hypothetical protein